MTARDFAQTVALCERFGIECDVIGRHRGAKLGAKAIGLVDRSLGAVQATRAGAAFDLAIGHGSNDITVAATALRIPRVDDVRLRVGQGPAQRQLPAVPGGRRARRDPARAPVRATAPRARSSTTRGSRRSTTSPTSSPTRRCSTSSASTSPQPMAVVRTPPVGLALPPLRERPLRRGAARAARAGAGRRPAARRRPARGAGARRRLHRPRARDRRAVADRLRRPRRERRRHDEPRGRRARHARSTRPSRAASAPSTSG